jgi:transmembrane sensor
VTSEQHRVVDQAIAWHLRRDEMNDADWQAFIIWLEASPLHATAYDEIALQDRLRVADPAFSAVNDNARGRGWWTIGLGTATAAALAVGLLMLPGRDPYSIVTQAGEMRVVALADGTRIELNGATRLNLDHRNPRIATLDRGEAMFSVRHDPAKPFVLQVGARTIEDLGTAFNVSKDDHRIDVQVAEGAVMFQPGKEAIILRPGTALSVDENAQSVAVSRVPADGVGGWRRGILSCSNVPLAVVRDAVERRYRLDLTLAGGLSERRFTGMVHLTGQASRDVPHLAALIGADWRNDGTRWILSPKDGAAAH